MVPEVVDVRVLALGGYGRVGQATVRILAESGAVSEIVVAGRKLDAASAFASEFGEKGSAVQVDATDESDLTRIAKDFDVIVNTAGPDFLVPLPAARVAITAGANYVDVCGDVQMTEKLLALDAEAEDANVILLIGWGCAPGLTNMMAMHASQQFDDVEEVRINWVWDIFGSADIGGMGQTRVNASWEGMMKNAGEKAKCGP